MNETPTLGQENLAQAGSLQDLALNSAGTWGDQGILQMITASGPVVKAVLILLIVLSVWSWAITIAKILHFRKARSLSEEFLSLFTESRNFVKVTDSIRRFSDSPLAQVFEAGYREFSRCLQNPRGIIKLDLGSIEGALRRAEFQQSVNLEKGVTFLASVASAAPFIGLFGTVWGIMNAFHGLSFAKATTIQAVAPGISEALVATAIGLAAAIPAAVAYNYFAADMRQFRESMDKFSADFLTVAKVQLEQQS